MAWLVVLGRGSWGGKGFDYGPGVHEIDAERAAFARSYLEEHPVSRQWLIVTDTKPEIVTEGLTGTLTAEDVKVGVTGGVRLPYDDEPILEVPPDPDAPPLTHGCQFCPKKFPSKAAADWHVEHNHDVQYEQLLKDTQAEAEAQLHAKSEIERIEQSSPLLLHPAERDVGAPAGEDAVDITLEAPPPIS
jgi:hypothetical protein